MGKAGADDAAVLNAVLNVDRGVPVASRVQAAGSSAARRKGLLGVDKLEAGSGIWIAPCEAIHTFGMRIPIDVLFLDRDFQVKKLISNLEPWRIAFCFSASSVLEVEAGTISRTGVRIGDRLKFKKITDPLRTR